MHDLTRFLHPACAHCPTGPSDLLVMLHVGVCCAVVFVPCSRVVTCLERADLLALVCGV